MDGNTYLIGFLVLILVATIIVLYKINVKLITTISPNAFVNIRKQKTNSTLEKEKNPSLMSKVSSRLMGSVPVTQEADILLDHDYDGIKELDNNLPPWWKWGFYATILFSFVYLIGYHVTGTGKLQLEEYNDELALAAKAKEERMKNSAENITEENVTMLTDAGAISKGKEIFTKNCAACHAADGGGMVGPNLTDEYWLHGGGIKNIFKTVTYGVPAKGMISWQSQLSPKQIQEVSSFVWSLQGTKAAAPKEQEGEKWTESSTASNTDSSATAQATKE
ncbi:MAG: c-type cytochrome [Bacteroidetes bacterium]|nr:c-type cytochrome [Bacteroidota bacterium]MCB8931136.1 c-type cytochrome [Bacteroidia bacterium]MCE7954872.1 cytochrome oxidase subunit III [Bacteroidetes bacterium CHB6]MCW5930410.1 c-type cytochrome [Bacteroidota bacterium]